MATQPTVVADFETQLSTAISIGSTSFSISSNVDDDGVTIPNGLYYFTVDNGSSTKEYIAGTLTGLNVTAAVSVSRQGVETSGAVRPHRVGASVILTDFATYKKYIDNAISAGGIPATPSVLGISELSIAAVSPATPIVVGDNDPRIFPNAYGVDSGVNDTYVISLATAPAAYVAGQVFSFKANTANTGAATLNINGLGAKAILRIDATALSDNDITANTLTQVQYDGTQFRLTSPRGGSTAATQQRFTSSGTYTKPSGLKYADVIVIAGGGAGNNNQGNSGSAGAGAQKRLTAAQISATETVVVGAAGVPGIPNGTLSSFTYNAGINTITANPGLDGGTSGNTAPDGGTATGGDINIPGAPGTLAINQGASGGSRSLRGGDAPFGMGFGGRGVSGIDATNGQNGVTATGFGSGGSGSASATDGSPGSSSYTAGSGAPGIVIVNEYY